MSVPTDIAHHMIAERIAERAHAARASTKCLTVGICGAQGSGKSTLAQALCAPLKKLGLRAVVLSLDDLYLRREERIALGKNVHPLLQTRGVPGTHDVQLGISVLQALTRPGVVRMPSFDKGMDDRRPESGWSRVQAPVDVVLFEGWCVGAIPQPQESLQEPVNALELNEDPDGTWRRYVNRSLEEAYRGLFGAIHFLILLAAPDFSIVHRWRLEQENALKHTIARRGSAGAQLMDEWQLQRFISHYERITRHILAEMPARADMVVRLDAERRMTFAA